MVIVVYKNKVNFYVELNGNKDSFYKTLELPLDESMQNSQLLDNPSPFTKLLLKEIKEKANIKKNKKVSFIFDNSYIYSKDFSHNKANSKQLEAIAKIEAEEISQVNFSKYTVLTKSYGAMALLDTYHKSYLYALPEKFLKELISNFKKSGYEITSIVAMSSVYNDFSKSYGKKSATGFTAFINFGKHKTLLSIYENNKFAYEGTFASLYEDIINDIELKLGATYMQAETLLNNMGIPDAGDEQDVEIVTDIVKTVINNAIIEVSRSANIAASAQRKDIEKVIITGDIASLPGFKKYFAEAFDSNCEILSEYDDMSFLSHANKVKMNFVTPILNEKRTKVNLNIIFYLLLFITLATFALKPVTYYNAIQNKNDATSKTKKGEYSKIKEKINNAEAIEKQLNMLVLDKGVIESKKTNSGVQFETITKAFTGKADFKSINYNTEKDIFEISFTVKSYENFVAVKNSIENSKNFVIATAFTYDNNDCSVSIKVKKQVKI